MRKFGLIGFPLSHSFSKKFFTEKFLNEHIPDCEYELFPIEHIGLLTELISKNIELEGLNVTIPYKLAVLPFLNEVDEAADQIGAVNCISIQRKNGQELLTGYNTDAYGFEESLKPMLNEHHKKALVFGDGGAAKAVKYVLNKLNIPFIVVTRSPTSNSILYDAVTSTLLQDYTILINTTPLGMSPNPETCPDIPYEALTENHLAYDLVYNPEETTFLAKSRASGASIKNGLEMLYLQAERSWYIWNK
ncbi:shikimate dehydrogenase family protein [Pedobacter panaciterrae]|jgi:Shikimate 5-dehydrogenase|uniref:Shikimate dehydrogenase n=1 Tax=Pedobacter panaciterrae TaxID=363849 RepID=A0ABU8NPJ3_9SPHI|nr:shikimate dehydrogenase [Pedobacter panaciterrae]NQX55414.1 shikimate dehydrogenase [Pedobacter panaciterrae]